MDMNKSPFFDFLRDVLYEQPFDASRMGDAQGLAVLDFCDNASLEMTEIDFGFLDAWNLGGAAEAPSTVQEMSPQSANSAEMAQMRKSLVQAWTESPWRWDPKTNDTGYTEVSRLAVSAKETSAARFQESGKRLERVVAEKLDQSARDRVLAILLSTCRHSAAANRVAASFPTAEVMDTLVHIFLASQACEVDEWKPP